MVLHVIQSVGMVPVLIHVSLIVAESSGGTVYLIEEPAMCRITGTVVWARQPQCGLVSLRRGFGGGDQPLFFLQHDDQHFLADAAASRGAIDDLSC